MPLFKDGQGSRVEKDWSEIPAAPADWGIPVPSVHWAAPVVPAYSEIPAHWGYWARRVDQHSCRFESRFKTTNVKPAAVLFRATENITQ